MPNKIPIIPDPETVKPPLVPTIPAPVPIAMPHPEQVRPENETLQKNDRRDDHKDDHEDGREES